MPVQLFFFSAAAQIQQTEQIAAKFQAMLTYLSGAASCVYQNPKHMPKYRMQHRKGRGENLSDVKKQP